jgi:DNA-binding response OmpR family regulator
MSRDERVAADACAARLARRRDRGPAARAIRLLPERQALPIVAMTANVFAEDREQCLAAGMNDHISKPVDPDRFYATVLRWLSKAAPARVPGAAELAQADIDWVTLHAARFDDSR